MPVFTLLVAVLFAGLAGLIWFTFLRPIRGQNAGGVIQTKTFKPVGEYWQHPTGRRDGFLLATRIPVAECYLLNIRLEGRPEEASHRHPAARY